MLKRLTAHRHPIIVSLIFTLFLLVSKDAFAQGTGFTYQGRLTDGSNPADGLYDMQFKLFDKAPVGTGTQEGPTITNSSVQVANGVFAVQLDFGPVFNGLERFLEISVRPSGSPSPYTALSPRQPLTPTPYAVRSATSAVADFATNTTLLGGQPASGFIQNTTSQQATTNFNISGNGTIGGTLAAGVVSATSQYNIGGGRVLSIAGEQNLFVGIGAGFNNTTGTTNSFFGTDAGVFNTEGRSNSFFGWTAGHSNLTGSNNAFFGARAGFNNLTGSTNSFFGDSAGANNTEGSNNSFFGRDAGLSNATGSLNSFFGSRSGQSNTTGSFNAFFAERSGFSNTEGFGNSFFGFNAGGSTSTGSFNSFFGENAGGSNTTGEGNTFIGDLAGLSHTTGNFNTIIGSDANVGVNNLSFATAIGAGAVVSSSNTIALGRSDGSDTVRIPGSLIVTGSISKGGGSFKIDHPLDPTNKTLSHSFVESPDMMNIYNGNAMLDQKGEVVITLPDYFEALNRDFRYQLTALGSPGPDLYISSEIKGNQFKIAGGTPGLKVSWQVTGVRQDAYANAHRIPVEEEKPARERGTYLHPDAFDKSRGKSDLRRANSARRDR